MHFVTKHIQPVFQWFKHVATQPRDELNRWQGAVRYSYELGIHGWKALQRDNAPQMAAALSFRTLFALVPVLVVSTVLIKGLRGPSEFHFLSVKVISAVGLYRFPIAEDSETGATKMLGDVVEEWVVDLSATDLSALGWIGLIVVIYSAIGLMVTIENSFNSIYGAPEGRGWVRRVLMYWAVLTLGPAFLGVTIYLDKQFGNMIEGVHTWKWLLTTVKFTWGFAVAWLFMFVVYRLVPNTKVTSRAALVGSFVTALFIQVSKSSLGAYIGSTFIVKSLSGSLSVVPVFMFWMYLMWLAILFGLEVSATVQTLAGRSLEELDEKRPQNGLVDPASVLNMMEIVTERFGEGLATTARHIADETLIQESMVCRMIDRMVEAGLLHRVESKDDGAVTLARPPEQLSGDKLLEIGFSLVDEGGVGRQSPLIQRLRDAQRKLAGQATLASILTQKPAILAESQGSRP